MITELLGTVSHGTMRQEDLIPSFLGVLEELDKTRWQVLVEGHQDVLDRFGDLRLEWVAGSGEYIPDDKIDSAHYLLDVLFDTLDDLAPEGYYFGANPGDGSDYGFWLAEDF